MVISLVVFFALKSNLTDVNISHAYFLLLMIAWYVFFPFCNGLNDIPQKDMPMLWKLNVTIFGKRVFTDVMKLRILRWDHPKFCGCTLNQMTSVFLSDRREKGHKREGHVKTEVEIRVMCLQTKEYLELLEAIKNKEGFFCRDFGGRTALLISWFQISGLQNGESINFFSFKPPRLWEFVRAALGI